MKINIFRFVLLYLLKLIVCVVLCIVLNIYMLLFNFYGLKLLCKSEDFLYVYCII